MPERDELSSERVVFVTLIVVLLVTSLSSFYRVYLYSLGKLLFDEGYGYLSVALVGLYITLFNSIKQSGYSFGVSPGRTIAGLFLLIVSLIFYFSASIDTQYMVQYYGLSYVFLFLSLFIVVFTPVYTRDLIPLFSIFLLVPPPPGWIDVLTPKLSRLVGSIAAAISGAQLVKGPGYSVLLVHTNSGIVRFQVEFACTGIVTLSSILVVFPVILYLLAYSPRSLVRKLTASVLALIIALLLGFIGNLIRVLLVIYGARALGPETGLRLFHYSPSIVYATLSLLAGFYIADKIGAIRLALPRLRKGPSIHNPRAVGGVLLILLLFVSIFTGVIGIVNYTSRANTTGTIRLAREPTIIIQASTPSDYLRSPFKYLNLYAIGIKVTGIARDEQLTRILNAFVVYRVIIRNGNSSYLGYLEIVDTPGRLHTWQLCLTLQGYKVVDSYTREINGTPVYFVDFRKGGAGYLLAFVLLPTRVVSPVGSVDLYTRVSIISPYNLRDRAEREELMSRLLASLYHVSQATSGSYYQKYINYLSLTAYLILLVAVGYRAYQRYYIARGAVPNGSGRGKI